MQEYCDMTPTPLNCVLGASYCSARADHSSSRSRAQAAGKSLLPPNGFLFPLRTAKVEEQRYLEVLGLLSTQNEKEPAERKHAAKHSYLPLAALCSSHSQNSSYEILTTPHICFFPLCKITDYGQGGFWINIKEHKSFITSHIFPDSETRHISKFSFFRQLLWRTTFRTNQCIPAMGSSVLAINVVINFYTVITEAQR